MRWGHTSRADNKRRPRVVLIHRYFWPDVPPYATILKEIALGLAQEGMDVTVLTCQPSYNRNIVSVAPPREELAEHVHIRRSPVVNDRASSVAKVANLVRFTARLAATLGLMRRVDAVMAATTPPVLLAMVVSLVCKGKRIPFIYHKQDIYPEVTDASAPLVKPLRAVLRRLDAGTDRRARRVVVLSRDMAEAIDARGADRGQVSVINNFDPWTLTVDEGPRPRRPAQPIRFVYAGNLGRFQNLDNLADAIAALHDDEQFTFDFIGDGPMRSWLERYVAEHRLERVRVRGYVDPADLATMLREQFDVGVLSLAPDVIRSAYPSKTMSYLRNGLPVLALVEDGNELVDSLRSYDAGWHADLATAGAAESAIRRIVAEGDQIDKMRENAKRMYHSEFDRSRQVKCWTSLFGDVLESSS